MKVATAHHPMYSDQEVDELFATGSIANYLLVVLLSIPGKFVAPKLLVVICPILNLKQFNAVICIYHLLRCLLLDMSSSLFSVVVMHFSIDLQGCLFTYSYC